MNTFQGPSYDGTVGLERINREDIDAKFEEALRFIDAYWTEFDDPSGVVADLDELRLAVSGSRPANPMRTRLTVHRLRRTAGNAASITAVLAVVREVLGTT